MIAWRCRIGEAVARALTQGAVVAWPVLPEAQQSHRPGPRALNLASLEPLDIVAPLLACGRLVALDEEALGRRHEAATGPAEAPGDDACGGAAQEGRHPVAGVERGRRDTAKRAPTETLEPVGEGGPAPWRWVGPPTINRSKDAGSLTSTSATRLTATVHCGARATPMARAICSVFPWDLSTNCRPAPRTCPRSDLVETECGEAGAQPAGELNVTSTGHRVSRARADH